MLGNYRVAEITACCWQNEKILLFPSFTHHPLSTWVQSLCWLWHSSAPVLIHLATQAKRAVSACQVSEVELAQPNLTCNISLKGSFVTGLSCSGLRQLCPQKGVFPPYSPSLAKFSCYFHVLAESCFFCKATDKIKVSFPWPFLRKAARSTSWEWEGCRTVAVSPA